MDVYITWIKAADTIEDILKVSKLRSDLAERIENKLCEYNPALDMDNETKYVSVVKVDSDTNTLFF